MRTCRSSFEASAPRAAVLIRFAVGVVFASEGIQKFLYADARGAGRFAKIGIPAPEMVVGAACWAVGMGAQDSIFKAAVAKLVPKEERGRAYGLFFAFFGLAWWIGSATIGWSYERSMTMLVVFSVVTQLAAVPLLLFVGLRLRRLEGARR